MKVQTFFQFFSAKSGEIRESLGKNGAWSALFWINAPNEIQSPPKKFSCSYTYGAKGANPPCKTFRPPWKSVLNIV